AISSSWVTIATIPPTAVCRSALAVLDCFRSRIWLAASTQSLVHGISPSKVGQFRIGRRVFGCRAFSRRCTECVFAAHDLFRKPVLTFRNHTQVADATRNAARLVPRPRDPVLEIAARPRADIALPHIGPRAASVVR